MMAHGFRNALRNTYLCLREPILKVIPKPRHHGAIPSQIQSVLIISQQRLGDVALEIPSLRLFRLSQSEARLGVVAPTPFHPLFTRSCQPQVLFSYPSDWNAVRALRATLREHEWQMVIDLTTDYHLRPALLAASTGAPIRIGFENAGRGRYFNVAIPMLEGEHMADRFQRLMAALGIRPRGPLPSLEIPDPPFPLPEKGPGQRLVGLHPGATHWTQRWPLEYFAELARKIHDAGHCCLAIGLETERNLIEEIVGRSGGAAVPILSDGNILRFAATLKRLDFLVCNNSGPLHLASLLEVPTLSFMGPTVKERWWPRGAHVRVLRRDNLPCIGCNQGYCKIRTHACMKEITPEEAYAAFETFRLSTL